MAIIYSRCYALFKTKQIDAMPSHEQMNAIGKIVCEKFIHQTSGKKPKLIQAPPYVGNFKVKYYPAVFTAEIDRSIVCFLSGKKERKRKKMIIKQTVPA